jgi:hypothetical protein
MITYVHIQHIPELERHSELYLTFMDSSIAVLHLEPFVLEARPLSLIQYLSIAHVFDFCPNVLGTCWNRPTQIHVCLFDEPQTI